MAADVTVVGAGVIGRTCALALSEAGHTVRVVAARSMTVSEIAGGLWLPYATAEDERVLGWALETLPWLESRGHPTVDYLHLSAREPWWLAALPPGRARAVAEGAWVVRVPLVEMPRHLVELTPERLERRALRSLDQLDGLVVNCTGLGARGLVDDPALQPARGQVVHLHAPPGIPCLCDDDALTYVLPRTDACIVGGTYELGDEDLDVRPQQTAEILARAEALVPQLAGAEIIDVKVGLRPVRDGGPRVERDGDVIHCYGHGGSGVTLSYGCARAVVELAG